MGSVIHGKGVVGRVANDAGDVTVYSIENLAGLPSVIGVSVGQYLGDDDTGAVDAQVKLLPPALSLPAVLRSSPLAFSGDSPADAIDNEVDRAGDLSRSELRVQAEYQTQRQRGLDRKLRVLALASSTSRIS